MEQATLTDLQTLLVENYVDFLIALVELGNMPHSTWEQEPHHFRLITGCEDEECNAIFSLEEPLLDPNKIKDYIAKMRAAHFPWVWMLKDTEPFHKMGELLQTFGLKSDSFSQGMIGPPQTYGRPFPGIDIAPVRTPQELELWLDVYERSFFQTEAPLCRKLFRRTLLESGLHPKSRFQPDLAYFNGELAGCNLLFYSHARKVGGFWCVGVLQEMRRRGIAQALIDSKMREMLDQHTPYALTWLDKNRFLFSNFSQLGLEPRLQLAAFEGPL